MRNLPIKPHIKESSKCYSVAQSFAGYGSKLSNLLQTNSIIVAYVYVVKRGEKERLAETLGFGGSGLSMSWP